MHPNQDRKTYENVELTMPHGLSGSLGYLSELEVKVGDATGLVRAKVQIVLDPVSSGKFHVTGVLPDERFFSGFFYGMSPSIHAQLSREPMSRDELTHVAWLVDADGELRRMDPNVYASGSLQANLYVPAHQDGGNGVYFVSADGQSQLWSSTIWHYDESQKKGEGQASWQGATWKNTAIEDDWLMC